MTKDRQKYLAKSSQHKAQLTQVVSDILHNHTDHYAKVALRGYPNYRRIRVGNLRIVYQHTPSGNIIQHIGPRGDIYKKLP